MITEAETLLKGNHFARAYFLACSSIEETGKAFQAWTGLGRNLKNPAVQTTLRNIFEDHSKKNMSGLISSWILSEGKYEKKENWEFMVDTSVQLLQGREKSMYVDVSQSGKMTIPNDIVTERNAIDTIKLAKVASFDTRQYISSNEPRKCSRVEDKYFEISNKKSYFDIMNNRDFWLFWMDEVKRHPECGFDFTVPTVKYYERYFSQKQKYSQE